MRSEELERGLRELARQRSLDRPLYWAVAFFGFFVNLLMLTGPIYMLEVYERVLTSRSGETLLALSVLAGFLFLMMGLIDVARARLTARIGARFHDRLADRVNVLGPGATDRNPAGNLAMIERAYGAPVLPAIHDVFWVPVFVIALAVVHPWLGSFAALSGLTLAALMIVSRATASATMSVNADPAGSAIRSDVGIQVRRRSQFEALRAGDTTGWFNGGIRTFRIMLQSAVLGLGAWLVLRNELSPGAMLAASVLLGRALAPIEVIATQWPLAAQARHAWYDLAQVLGRFPALNSTTGLPRPLGKLQVNDLSLRLNGEAGTRLRGLGFEVGPGGALGVIGPTGSGKTLLARVLTGQLRSLCGEVRLGGARPEHYGTALSHHIGYVPQTVTLDPGTIADNIAGFASVRTDASIIAAARSAAAHEMILRLPNGYDTPVGTGIGTLSAGQVQRIGLARAIYGTPVLLVFDEPATHLDGEGLAAMNRMIGDFRAGGGAVVLMTHRPSLTEICDDLLVLDAGGVRAYGPRLDVLRDITAGPKPVLVRQRRGA